MLDIALHIEDPSAPEVAALVAKLDAFLDSLYPPDPYYLMPVAALCEPHVTFLTARCESRLVGCGAILNHNGEYGEVKRMFVVPEFRGHKIASRILAELERIARAQGLPVMRMETGCRQTEAIRFYENAGYVRRAPFGDYPQCDLSVFFEKPVTPPDTTRPSNTAPPPRAP
jgi:putative acetyltransferase